MADTLGNTTGGLTTGGTPLTWGTYLGYGIVALPLALIGLTFYVYLPKFYSDVIGVNLATISGILIVSRIWDAVIDPFVGNLSDRTRSSWGRRRPWILCGLVPLAGCFFLLLDPALCPSWMSLGTWFAVGSMLFFIFWTFINVPYEALGAELSFNFHERTKLLGVRDGLTALGTLLAAVFPLVLSKSTALDERQKFFVTGIVYGLLLIAAGCWCVRRIKERQWEEAQRPKDGLVASVKGVFRNRPFRILLSAYVIGAFGAELPATLLLFYVPYVLKSTHSEEYLGLYLLVGLVFLPMWIKLSGKFGKKQAWLGGMFINTAAFAGVFFLGAGDEKLYAILVVMSAIGYGATLAIPSSMQADVVDYDEMLTGERKEGQFIGFWLVAKKLVRALGAGLGLAALDMAGYVPNGEQPESALFALRLFYAGVPCLCNFLSIIVAWRYPIDQKLYDEVRARIAENKAAPAQTSA